MRRAFRPRDSLPRIDAGTIVTGVVIAALGYVGFKLYQNYWSPNSVQLSAIEASNNQENIATLNTAPAETMLGALGSVL